MTDEQLMELSFWAYDRAERFTFCRGDLIRLGSTLQARVRQRLGLEEFFRRFPPSDVQLP